MNHIFPHSTRNLPRRQSPLNFLRTINENPNHDMKTQRVAFSLICKPAETVSSPAFRSLVKSLFSVAAV